MAKIVKTREVEIGLEELIALLKKNWSLLGGFLTCNLSGGNKIRVEACFNLVSINKALCQTEGLITDKNELAGAIVQIFREMESQKQYLKNMEVLWPISSSLNISFEIDIAPVMPVDPLDIPRPDNLMDPNDAKRAEIMQLVR